jgi:hypothetical protein
MPSPVWYRRDRLFAVHAGKATDDSTRRDLILASAYFHASPPRPGERIRASCARVLRHALNAAGLWEDRMRKALHGEDDGSPEFRVVNQWYETLIDLVRRKSERLLEGAGNLGDSKTGTPPAGAYYTACWLTPAGRIVAERVLAEQPKLKASLTAPEV